MKYILKITLKILIYIYQKSHYIAMCKFYGSLKPNCYISPFSSIKNHKNIFLGNNSVINRNVIIWCNLKAGNNVHVNPGACIYGTVMIGNNVMIAPNVMIAGGNHGTVNNGVPMLFQTCVSKGITIGNDVWIGANSVIVDGVKISEGVIIGAGAVVTKDLPPYSIWTGNPARLNRFR